MHHLRAFRTAFSVLACSVLWGTASPAQVAEKRTFPEPRWTNGPPERVPNERYGNMMVRGDLLIVQSSVFWEVLTALDRFDGTLRWRYDTASKSTPPPGLPPNRDRAWSQTLRQVLPGSDSKLVALWLTESKYLGMKAAAEASAAAGLSGDRKIWNRYYDVVQVLDGSTGQLLWDERFERPLQERPLPVMLPVRLTKGVLVMQSRDGKLAYRDGRTGKTLIDAPAQITSRIRTLPHSLSREASAFPVRVFTEEKIANLHFVWHVNGDRRWEEPKWLEAFDDRMRRVWTFEETRKNDARGADSGRGERGILRGLVPVAEAGIVVTWSDSRIYGVRVKDGKKLWDRPLVPFWTWVVASAGKGVLMVWQPKDTTYSALGYLDAQTGRLRWLAWVPLSERIACEGNNVYLQTMNEGIWAYSLSQLIASGGKGTRLAK